MNNKKITANTIKSILKDLIDSVTNDGDSRHFTVFFKKENYFKVAYIGSKNNWVRKNTTNNSIQFFI